VLFHQLPKELEKRFISRLTRMSAGNPLEDVEEKDLPLPRIVLERGNSCFLVLRPREL
jgi:hypothetical protein